jgi:hypothetical protein
MPKFQFDQQCFNKERKKGIITHSILAKRSPDGPPGKNLVIPENTNCLVLRIYSHLFNDHHKIYAYDVILGDGTVIEKIPEFYIKVELGEQV